MFGIRWWRAGARGMLGVLATMPSLALVLAVVFDRADEGPVRFSMRPMALSVLDPFVWTCARNSVIFAVVLTTAMLLVGVGLGWAVGRRRFWGRSVLGAGVAAMLAAAPACLALGLVGLWGTPQPWPWPIAAGEIRAGGASLESWRGVPLWGMWLWSTLPGSGAGGVRAAAGAGVGA